MGIFEQIKLANAARRLHQRMCNKCRIAWVKEFKRDKEEQELTGLYNRTPQQIQADAMALLCTKCKKVYQEAIENR